MAKQLDFLALGKEIEGIRTTEGFDVLVSYSEEKINQLLRARSQEVESILNFGPLNTSYSDPVTDEDVELDVFMTVDHPLIQFEDEHGNITLTFDIQKAHYDVKDHNRTITLPSGMVLSFKTTLSNVTGTVDSSQSKDGFAGKGAKAAPANKTVLINPDEKDISQGVCITFQKASVDLIGTTDESRKAAKGKTFMLDALKQYFQENAELKYFVAGVSNQYDPQLGSHSLQPRSFCFNTLKGKTKDDESALCMWISVKEGTNKDQSSKRKSEGIFSDRGLIPIPRGRTCSLIVDNDLLMKQYLMVQPPPSIFRRRGC